jgi:hypothetical protein
VKVLKIQTGNKKHELSNFNSSGKLLLKEVKMDLNDTGKLVFRENKCLLRISGI